MTLKTYIAVLLSAFSLTTAAQAHDFWLAPDTYAAQPGNEISVSVMIGHPSDRMRWPVAPHRVVAFRSLGPNGIQDHQRGISSRKTSGRLPVKLKGKGLHILTLETTRALSILDADLFNAYLEEEGLSPIKLDRAVKGATGKTGRELYSRRGKALIQIGERGAKDPDYLAQPLGLTLEIVPTQHPARTERGGIMTSKVYYRGQPVRGVTIGLIDLGGNAGLVEISKTDAVGNVSFKRPARGDWMLHAVWASPMDGNDRAEYDTVFSSLSFSLD